MSQPALDLSVIIVNYNVKHFAEQCLRSVFAASRGLQVEVILIDNASSDGSVPYLQERFPNLTIIANDRNLGFGRANNLALKQAQGRYFLILNPDTLVSEDLFRVMLDFLDRNPEAGAAGPKILARDGSFDPTSKRGFPTPWVAFCKLSGLSRLAPRSRLLGKYNVGHISPDQTAEIDSLVGSCMFIRREVYAQIGGFDEDYFMYGEDLDWCYRIKQAGWKVFYAPVSTIIHFKGESTRRSDFDRERAFYGAMHLFVDKHLRRKYFFAAHWIIGLGILIAEAAARLRKVWSGIRWHLLDWSGLFAVQILGRMLRWGAVGWSLPVVFSTVVQSTVWTLSLAGFGAYRQRRGQWTPVLLGMLTGFLINSSFTYFFRQFAFSRFVVLFGLVAGGLYLILWRVALKGLRRSTPWLNFYRRRSLIVGAGEVCKSLLLKLQSSADLPYHPIGVVDPENTKVGTFISNLPVLGGEDDLGRLVKQEDIEEVFFAADTLDYDRVLKTVGSVSKVRRINFKVIPPETAAHPDGLTPLLSVEYLAPRGVGKSLRKISTLVLKR